MPSRRPNKLYGTAKPAGADKSRGDIVYIETDSESDCSHGKIKPSSDALHLAQQEIWRLQDAVKTLEACLQSKAPDTSVAWKAEAEKSQADAKQYKRENKMLLEELMTVKNALAGQCLEGKGQVDEAVELESKRWQQRLAVAGQEAEEVRHELQHTLTRLEELEMTKTKALFELTEERNKVHPRGVDFELHQTTLQELSATRARLKDEEERSSGLAERIRTEAARAQTEATQAQAEATQATNYLKRIVKECRTEHTEAQEAIAQHNATINTLTAENKLLQSKVAALQAECVKRAEVQQQWTDWSLEVTAAARRDLLQGCSLGQDFDDMRLRLKSMEANLEKATAEAQQKLRQLAAGVPKTG